MTREGVVNLLRMVAEMGEKHTIIKTTINFERNRDGQYHVNANVKYEEGDEVKWLLLTSDVGQQKCDA